MSQIVVSVSLSKLIDELFAPDVFKKSELKIFNYPASCVAVNDGNGNFSIRKMPAVIQFSSVNAIRCIDVNADGYPDLVMGGNQFLFQ